MLLLSILWACAPKIPLHLQDPVANPHPNCIPSENIVALGFSTESISDAQQNARNRVAEQVSSHIETVQIQRKQSTQSSDGTEENRAELVQESMVSVQFSQYDLVQDIGEVFSSKQGFRALACLNLSQMEERLVQENSSLLKATVKLGREVTREKNLHAFSVKRQKFHRYMGNLEGFFILLHSLKEQYSMQEMELRQLEDQVEARANKFRQQYTIVLDGSVAEEYQRGLQEVMQVSGLRIEQGRECREDAFLFVLDPTVTPTEGPMGGVLTSLKIRALLRNCQTGEERQIVLSESKGYHSTDRELSITEAWKAIDERTLPQKLGSLFPLLGAVDQ